MTAPDTGCQLCGAHTRLTMALVRVAWEHRAVLVKACPRCAALAWATVDELCAEKPKDSVWRVA